MGRSLIIAASKTDAKAIMREEWGEAFQPILHRGKVAIKESGDEKIVYIPSSQAAEMWGRGIAPKL